MKKMPDALKAALLSGLIFPGLGQLFLKHHKRGITLMLVVLACLAAIVVKGVQQSLAILEKIASEGGVIDMKTVSSAVSQTSTTSSSLIFNLGLLLIIICWIIGVVDAYRIGKKKDIADGSTGRASNGSGR